MVDQISFFTGGFLRAFHFLIMHFDSPRVGAPISQTYSTSQDFHFSEYFDHSGLGGPCPHQKWFPPSRLHMATHDLKGRVTAAPKEPSGTLSGPHPGMGDRPLWCNGCHWVTLLSATDTVSTPFWKGLISFTSWTQVSSFLYWKLHEERMSRAEISKTCFLWGLEQVYIFKIVEILKI